MAVVAEKQAKRWTYEEYYRLDDDRRYEVIEGKLIDISPAPSTWHQDWLGQLGTRIYNFNERRKLGRVYFTPVDVVFSEENCMQPDIIFVANENQGIIQFRAVFGAPDLAVELISPSTGRRDKGVKKRLYEQFGVKEFWLGDPVTRELEVFTLQEGKYEPHCEAKKKGLITSVVLRGFEFDLKDIK